MNDADKKRPEGGTFAVATDRRGRCVPGRSDRRGSARSVNGLRVISLRFAKPVFRAASFRSGNSAYDLIITVYDFNTRLEAEFVLTGANLNIRQIVTLWRLRIDIGTRPSGVLRA